MTETPKGALCSMMATKRKRERYFNLGYTQYTHYKTTWNERIWNLVIHNIHIIKPCRI
jgi:hypothetical protein